VCVYVCVCLCVCVCVCMCVCMCVCVCVCMCVCVCVCVCVWVGGTERDKVTVVCLKQHDGELHVLHCTLYITDAINSRWAKHIARMGTQTTGWTTRCSIPDMSKRFVSSAKYPGWLFSPPSLQSVGIWRFFFGDKAAEAWNWPDISIYYRLKNEWRYSLLLFYIYMPCTGTPLSLPLRGHTSMHGVRQEACR